MTAPPKPRLAATPSAQRCIVCRRRVRAALRIRIFPWERMASVNDTAADDAAR